MRIAAGALALTILAAACGSGIRSSASPGPLPVAAPQPSAASVATATSVGTAAAEPSATAATAARTSTSQGVSAVQSSAPANRAGPSLGIAARLGDEGGAQQLIVVDVAQAADTFAQLQAFDRVGGAWVPAMAPMTARIGRNGVSSDHHEGDGTTPSGVYTLTEAFGNGPDPGSRLPYRPVHAQDYWVTDPASPLYNTWQVGPPNGRWSSAEALWTITQSYWHAVVFDYNRAPVVPGRGSAMFVHVRNENPTSGCVAVDLDQMVALIRWLDPAKSPKIAIGTADMLTA